MKKERDRAFGIRLKTAMKVAGYRSAKKFCEKHHMVYLTVAQHMQGTRFPTEDTLIKYSKLFGVSKEWLETGKGIPLSSLNKSKKILKISAAEIKKQVEINKHLREGLDVPILAEIIKNILSYKFSITEKTALQLAEAASYIYSDITDTDDDLVTKLQIVKPAVLTFLRTIKS